MSRPDPPEGPHEASSVEIAPGTSPAVAAGRLLRTLGAVCAGLAGGVAAFTAVAVAFFFLEMAPMAPGALPPWVLPAAAAAGVALLGGASAVEGRLRAAAADASMADVARRFYTGTLVGFALREAPTLAGLVLSLLVGTPAWALGFGLAGVVAMALGWPRRDDLETRLRRAAARL